MYNFLSINKFPLSIEKKKVGELYNLTRIILYKKLEELLFNNLVGYPKTCSCLQEKSGAAPKRWKLKNATKTWRSWKNRQVTWQSKVMPKNDIGYKVLQGWRPVWSDQQLLCILRTNRKAFKEASVTGPQARATFKNVWAKLIELNNLSLHKLVNSQAQVAQFFNSPNEKKN